LLKARAMLRTLECALLLGALVTSPSGCAGPTRRDAGTVLAATGGLTALAGAAIAVGCVPMTNTDDSGSSSCEDDDLEPNPQIGLPVVGAGIALAVGGAVVYGTGAPPPLPAATSDPKKQAPGQYLY
jgi:hypothetical protein